MRQIIIEATENPRVMKFVADYNLIPGSLELDRNSDISEIPLAQELFNYPFVDKIFITANFIAVAKQDTVEWEHVVQSLKNVIEDELLANPRIYRQQRKEVYQIYAEMTPNPSVMKFVASRLLLDGFVEVKSREEATEVPLAQAIFKKFSFAQEVFISDNFVAVTKDDSVQWHEVMVVTRAFIAEYLQNGGEVSHKEPQKHENPVEKIINREYTDTEQKISDILNEYVAPAVENDGGKISLMEYDESTKTAKMLLQGACSGCPSSTATLKGGIENVLKQFLPDLVEKVEAVNG
ncbi:NifU family protein [Riemerella anatipestifer]|uniref:Nitrogen-fixing nifu domain-containing protein n=1 Tax=Riemerella anatipestifer TaxID=34085 RepID=A0A1S7DT60_RIEAN|nr:NifU family protein [Riemerella anatipestifer]AQY22241.1 nitrogen-fixing nifu domain-containing protein [Riemerella anatipestifer]MCO4304463.1 NifU family protein [Riemerella anatipestifer]MCO7353236.1 NifU family protein [Riemerella anatipestifer]MCQ4039830.1 NifU family protein [Riemerella anatipestifer]MCT6761504.1 NifU family protein [Riemerella anatipestifer]